ncbi:MAG: DUF5925 domain-containing protein [Actinomycetota bacterium]|nr:DUF5925 domain-containing protein [Actinomycetota bacterium]
MNNTMNTQALGISPPRPRLHDTRPDAVPQALFVAELLAQSLTQVTQDSFRGSSSPAQLQELGAPVLVRSDPQGNEVEALIRLQDKTVALVDAGHGHVRVEIGAACRKAADAAAARLRSVLAFEPPEPDRVSVAFWMRGEFGADVRHREIEAPSFGEIAGNYSSPVRDELQRLIELREPPASGRLILWRGTPGTGKSHALRALAREWAQWCSAHIVMDPDELLGRGGAYMLELLSWSGDGEDRWRLVVFEDAGELIACDARAQAGQALSRLLNVADGILGQGTRTLLLITTNEPLGRLHPAVHRPGRCLCDLEFSPLSMSEANEWLSSRGRRRRVNRPTPLAELYGQAEEREASQPPAASGFGFARALDR